MRRAAFLLLLLVPLATACHRPVLVVPCPEPPALQEPLDPVDLLGPASTPAETVKAYAASRLIWKQVAKARADLLNAYRKQESRR